MNFATMIINGLTMHLKEFAELYYNVVVPYFFYVMNFEAHRIVAKGGNEL